MKLLGLFGLATLVLWALHKREQVQAINMSETWLEAQRQRTNESYDGPCWKWPVKNHQPERRAS